MKMRTATPMLAAIASSRMTWILMTRRTANPTGSHSSLLYGPARPARVFPILTATNAHQSTGLPDPSYRPFLPAQPRRPASSSLTPALTPACSGLAPLRCARH